MNSTSSTLINLAIVWGVASAAGFVAMAGLMILGDWTLIQALFAAAVIFFALGAALSLLFMSPLPGPQKPGSAGKPAETAKPAAPAHHAPAPVAAPAAAPVAAAEPPAVAAPVEAPAPAPEPAPAAATAGPARLDAPRGGTADDLKRIKGIGPKLEQLCHSMGFYHFDQIAAWTPEEVAWVDDNLEGFKGRVTRDNWVEQARALAAGG